MAQEKREGQTTIDAKELQELNRTGADLRESIDEVESEVKASEEVGEREPEIRTEGERSTDSERRKTSEREPSEEVRSLTDRLAKLERDNEELRRGRGRESEATREPQIEFVEVVPGLPARLPKDRTHYPIKLTPELMKAVGIDPGEKNEVMLGLEKLGNLLYYDLMGSVANAVPGYLKNTRESDERETSRRLSFEEKYPDLKEHTDLTSFFETKIRSEGGHQNVSQDEYFQRVAKRTRENLARMRGVSYDEYMRTVNVRSKSNGSRTVSRASSGGSTSARPHVSRGSTGGDREMNDMIDN